MEKILVTTDFSTHSKSGLRFAIQLASQKNVELIFFHCFHAMIPTSDQLEYSKNWLAEQHDMHLQKLKKWVENIYKSMKIMQGAHRFVVIEDLNPHRIILEYARQHDINIICISTRGAGTIRKLIGTNTSHVILHSPVPVLAVPHHYRVRPIQKILYASDMENIQTELPKVASFAQSISAKADLVHFHFPGKIPVLQESEWHHKYPSLDRIWQAELHSKEGFSTQLDGLITKTHPSLVVFFTHYNHTWFDKIFGSSKSENFSFVTKIPMLVFRKDAV